MIGTGSRSGVRVRKDLSGAPIHALRSENMISDTYLGTKCGMKGRHPLKGEAATLIHVREIDKKHLQAMDFAINTLTDQTVLATIFLEIYDISLPSTHKSI